MSRARGQQGKKKHLSKTGFSDIAKPYVSCAYLLCTHTTVIISRPHLIIALLVDDEDDVDDNGCAKPIRVFFSLFRSYCNITTGKGTSSMSYSFGSGFLWLFQNEPNHYSFVFRERKNYRLSCFFFVFVSLYDERCKKILFSVAIYMPCNAGLPLLPTKLALA